MKKTNWTWANVERAVELLANYVEEMGLKPECVYGIPRGGIIPAQAIAKRLGIKMLPFGPLEITKDVNKVLMVDDIIDSGETMRKVVEQLGAACEAAVALCSKGRKMESFGPFTPFVAKVHEDWEWIVFPWEEQDVTADNAGHVTRILELIGEDPTREGLVDTPKRFIKAMQEMTVGYEQSEDDIYKATFTAERIDQLVVIPRIEFFSTCEHHLFPFYGHVYIGYIPKGRVLGLSKFARLVRMYSRRLQVQELMTEQICSSIMEHLDPVGAGVIVQARHLCMAARGIECRDAGLVTSSLQGIVRDYARAEFLTLAGLSGQAAGQR